jgi:hypothetical protein
MNRRSEGEVWIKPDKRWWEWRGTAA